ncbi:MAG: repeat protein [Candidatus Midichloriaceae bacterium]|jgi:hypothetical protein|nr:repeat protein [Candidatus Midichloriaceae bacterium]
MRSIPELLKKKYGELISTSIPTVIKRSDPYAYHVTKACIDLRIIEREDAKDKEMRFRSHGSTGVKEIEDLRNAQLKMYIPLYDDELPDTRASTEIEQIFTNQDQDGNAPKKIAVYGRPGVGKSTLCQYLSVKWKEGNLWAGKFDAVFWIPLRELIGCEIDEEWKELYLAEIVKQKCMPDGNNLTKEEIAEYLFDEANQDKLLFILDGYDEIAHAMPKALEILLSSLFLNNKFHIITTSRPIAIELNQKPIEFDLKLENVGFTKENIRKYIAQFYQYDQEALIKLIESNQHLHDIAHTPLNLQLICDGWGLIEKNDQLQDYTATKLYQKITEHLFSNVMAKKGVYLQGLSDIEKKLRQEILMDVLSEIAIAGMTNHTITIPPERITSIIEAKEKLTGIEGLLKEVLALGIIKTVDTYRDSKDNSVYFIHLTFQEYFAGLYIAKAFDCPSDDMRFKKAVEMLQNYKYIPYYEAMWVSTAGILYLECINKENYYPLLQFWDAFENEPRELLGLTHDRLKNKLIEQLPNNNLPDVLKRLKMVLVDSERVASDLLEILKTSTEPAKKVHAIEALVKLGLKTDVIVKGLEDVMKNDAHPGVKLYAAEGLLRLGQESKEALGIIIDGLGHFEEYIQAALRRIYKTLNVNSEVKDEVAKYIKDDGKKYDEKQVDFIHLVLRELYQKSLFTMTKEHFNRYGEDSSSGLVGMLGWYAGTAIAVRVVGYRAGFMGSWLGVSTFMTGLFGGIEAGFTSLGLLSAATCGTSFCYGVNSGVRFLVAAGLGVSGVLAAGSFNPAMITSRRYYRQFSASISPDLDKIALTHFANEEEKLKAIRDKAGNNVKTITAWSKEGVLDLVLAIRLYSFSSQTAWLEPMKEITFIFKDPNIFLRICSKPIKGQGKTTYHKIITHNDQELTKNGEETEAVLGAMREGYVKAKMPTKLFKHYLKGASLDISTSKEKMAIARRIRSNSPIKLTPLHEAAAAGNIIEVKRIIESKEVDINDFNNQNWETPLILAIQNKKWEVVEYLVDNGADASIGYAIGLAESNQNFIRQFDRMVIKGLLNESSLEKILCFSVDDYKIQTTTDGKKAVLNRLAKCITGEDRNWLEVSNYRTDIYRLFLSNISDISRESINFGSIKGAMPAPILKMRLHVYLELYVRICALEPFDFPKINSEATSLAEVQGKLYEEINIIMQTFATANYEVSTDLFHEYFESVYNKLLNFKKGEEFIFTSMTYNPHHCMYVSLHKLNKNDIMIRSDNRYLDGKYDSAKHGKKPYKVSNKIKSCCIGIFNLRNNKDILAFYIKNIFKNGYGDEKFPHVYGKYLQEEIAIPYEQLPIEVKNYIEEWPYHRYQASATNNCTLSSYNLGISVRQGMEFCEWLIGKEQQIASPFSSTNVKDIITSKCADKDLLFGGAGGINEKLSYTHVELMKKFQKELNVPYSEVFTGVAVEQGLVGLAGITTSQVGARFRQSGDVSTVFHLNFKDIKEQQCFIHYYNIKFPGLIGHNPIKKENGQVSIIIETKRLYEEVAPALGRYRTTQLTGAINEENGHARWG